MFCSAILKLTAACNLNCSYCYMFNLNDQTHRRVPGLMPKQVALAALKRIDEHAQEFSLRTFNLILHGGEPTLWPISFFQELLNEVGNLERKGLKLNVSIQTNAYKLDEVLLELFANHSVRLGISVDGPRSHHDEYRVNHKGEGSYEQVMSTVDRICTLGYRDLIGGFLTVAHTEIPPEAYLAWIKTLPVPRVSVLWPIDFNYNNPPWKGENFESYLKAPRYGMWFANLFELWWLQNDPDIEIRYFFDVIAHLLGRRQHGDSIVNDVNDMLVINTDGGFEYPDYYRAFVDGGSRTKFSVSDHSLTEAISDPIFEFNLNMRDNLPEICHACEHKEICGGGFLPGRMHRKGEIPYKKSVLCFDHFYFFSAVKEILSCYEGKIKPRGASKRNYPISSV